MRTPHRLLLTALLATTGIGAFAQFSTTNSCTPTTTKGIKGVTTFERTKYINLSTNVGEAYKVLKGNERLERYFGDLDMSVGRALGMVHSEKNWGNSLYEDPDRAGYVDIDKMKVRFMTQSSADRTSYPYFESVMGSNQDLAVHDRHGGYPAFMEQYKDDKSDELYPTNTDAAGELVANMLKYRYNDFTRPKYYEIVNEPSYHYWSNSKFIQLHTDVKDHVHEMGLAVNVGGPCYSVSNFYQNNYGNLSHITNFIDNTHFSLDFYSFHTYDYINWDSRSKEFGGQINSGLPLDGVLDALASHTFNHYGRELKYVASEHGGYISDPDTREMALDYYAEEYFEGEGFEYEMERRTIENFLMVNGAIANTFTFVDHPHVVLKAVPFILSETSGWDTRYYSSLLVKRDFDKTNPEWVESKLIHFYEFFKGVEGRRIDSWCEATDIQHFALVNENTLMLLYHNQSNEVGTVTIDLQEMSTTPSQIKVRRLGKDAEDQRPYLTEESVQSLPQLKLEGQESVVVFMTYPNAIEQKRLYNEVPHYATTQAVQFTGSKTFTLPVTDKATIKESYLRVGVHRKNGTVGDIRIVFNGKSYTTHPEAAAPRLTGDNGYVTTRMVRIPASEIKSDNTVTVTFADGGAGGVGAVVLRAMHEVETQSITVKM